MHDTSFWTKETGRLATAYRPSQDGPVIFDPPDGAWSRPPRFADGASGLISTADDLLAFARMLAGGGGGVLTPESARAMTSDQLTDAQKRSGGLGEGFFDGQSWSLGQAVMQDGSFGWDGGMGTSWLVDPGSGLVVIVLTQLMFETPALPRIHREIRAAAWAAPA
jgi:CubicO group peptidase (beta-lactamase class C family)